MNDTTISTGKARTTKRVHIRGSEKYKSTHLAMRWTMWGLLVLLFQSALNFSTALDWAVGLKNSDNSLEGDDYDYEDMMNFLIFPGTKWCGSGSIAEDDNDLGSHPETDSCCREHDKCPDLIEAGETKYGLTNYAPYTRLHCDCDEKFLNCLKSSSDDMKVSQMVGTLYFDMLKTKCFKQEHKIIGCDSYNQIAMRCEKYRLDPNAPKSWQWFDVPVFHL